MIGLCLRCPDEKVGLTIKNIGTAIAIYGSICLLWLLLNRFVASELVFMDSICTFCQVRLVPRRICLQPEQRRLERRPCGRHR